MAKNLVTLNVENVDYSIRPYGTCSTPLNIAAKTVAITNFTLCTGATVLVKFSNGNRANNITLNVNETGAKPVKCVGNVFNPNLFYEFIYDGINWVLMGDEKHRCAHNSSNKNNYPYHRIAYTDVFTSTWTRRTIVLILNQAVFGGKYGELVIKVASNNTNEASSYEAYWIMNKGFGADDIKIGVNNTFGDTYFDVFYKMPGTWYNMLVEQKTTGGDSNFYHSWNLCGSMEVSDTTTTDKLTSIECYATVESAATEIRGKAYTAIVSPNVSSGKLGKITFNGDLTGNATTATNVNITTSSSNGDYPLLFTTNVTAGNKGVYTDTENVLSYNPSTNLLKTRAIEVVNGPLTLYTASGDSPALVFQRGTLTNDATDWRMYVTSGKFQIQNNINNNGWTNVFEFSSPDRQTTLTSSYSITAPSFTGNLVGNASSATHLAGGAAGSIPYQTAAGTTAMLAKGTSGQVLKINSNGLPTWATDNNTTYTFGTGLESVNSSTIAVKYDNKTLFAGSSAKDSNSITDSYTGHPLQLGKDYGWINTGNNLSNLNNFVDYGIYNISGEHTRLDDNVPIMNTGGGNTFQCRLMVYDSSLANTGNAGNDCCITQVLTLSNRVGGDGNTYIRTGVGSTKSSLTWGPWGKHQTNVEVGVVGTLDNELFINNGMYSGILGTDGTTFVLITVNNYASAGSQGLNPICTQLLYGVTLDGTIRLEKRTCTKADSIWQYNEWHSLENDANTKTKIIPLATGNKLVNNSIHYISSATTINGFIEPPSNEAYTYTIVIDNVSPSNVKLPANIKWAGGDDPTSSQTIAGLYEIIINGINYSNYKIYTGTWAKYE